MATTNFKIKNGLLSKRYLQNKSAVSTSSFTTGITSLILQTTGDNSSWVQKTTDISAYGGATVRPVYWYDMIASVFTADLQLDNIVVGNETYTFTNNATGWQTTQSSTNIGSYSAANFHNVGAGTAGGRVYRDSGGTPSSGTGSTTDADGSSTGHYLYFETSSPANSSFYNFLLRGPEVTLPINNPTWSWFENRTGTNVGNLNAYLDIIGGTTATLDLSQGSYFTFSLGSSVTAVFSNPPASGPGGIPSKAYSFALEVVASGDYTITWPDSIKWEGGSAPANTASGATDLYTFITINGGTTYFGKKALTGVS
tara:strand:- start:156 stop:1091 length:936 start_codon:yes stop_codon:yes gene_type:complete